MTHGFALDSDCFMRSKREHYAPDICPGFWDALLKGFDDGNICSISQVKTELEKGNDAVADWAKQVNQDFFCSTSSARVQKRFGSIAKWVQDSKYDTAAKSRFLSGADGWLVAFACDNDMQIVSYEVSDPLSKQIKLPDVAASFNVKCVRPFQMLRKLGVRLHLQ